TAIHYDSSLSDDERRKRLYAGDLFVYSPNSLSVELVDFARSMLEEAFAPLDPQTAQYHLPVEEYAKLLGEFKPRFIHHPECKRILPRLLSKMGCVPEATYFDVPRIRTSTSDDYLTTGIAYAFHPHRDTWYSAPMCQINWWLPIFDIEAGNAMAFHPNYFHRGVTNDSDTYNYQEWNAKMRFNAAEFAGDDRRPQPHAQEQLLLEPKTVVVTPPGGMLLFSAAQMHSSIPNQSGQTRFSIDFRCVHLGDLKARRGARNVDSKCTGSAINDYLQASTL